MGGLGAFFLGGTGWILWKAIENPDVRAKRPGWVPSEIGTAAYWTPLLLTMVIGSGLVALVLWTAYRRLKHGEDLYSNRYGKGQRRRGEKHLGESNEVG